MCSIRGMGCLLFAAMITAASANAQLARTQAIQSENHLDSGDETVVRHFREIAERFRKSDNSYFGYAQIDDLKRKLKQPALTPDKLIEYHGKLAVQLLRVDEVEEAAKHIEITLAEAQASPKFSALLPMILRNRGAIYFRQAETLNCIQRHNSDCCQFPLRRGGIHTEKEPARKAQESFLQYLRLQPRDLNIRWMLNLAHMALGDYPDAVPEKYRIPSQAFESEHDIGRFVDIAPNLKLDTFNLAGGTIVEDFNADGFLDVISSTSDPFGPLTYHHNLGNGQFEDRSRASGLAQQLGGLNCIGGDYDNDGDVDVLVLRGAWLFEDGEIRNSLLKNNGDGTFSDVTHAAGLANPSYPTQAAAWGDFDLDGDLDLYVANESRVRRWPKEKYPCQLFRNNGDGTFTDIAESAGVTNDRFAKGVATGDYDDDGDLDLYVSNIGPNKLYRNNGDGTFTDVAQQAGVIEPKGRSFACWFFDYDNDSHLDLFVAAYEATVADIAADCLGLQHRGVSPRLYRNQGDGTFSDVAGPLGLQHAYLPMGANFGDLDNDGYLDIYLGTGNPNFQTLVPNVMLRNDLGKRFQNVTTSGGFGHLQKGHGIAFADLDNDGDQDIYHQLGGMLAGDKYYNALFENPGHGNHFLVVDLVGKKSNRLGYGARIKLVVETAEGKREIHRCAGSVSSFGGSPARQEIGLGDAQSIESLEIWWPASGDRRTYHKIPLDRRIRIVEGNSVIEELDYRPIEFGTSSELPRP